MAHRLELPRPRARYAVPLLAISVIGAPLCLGGAPAWSVPLFAGVASVAMVITGFSRSTVEREWILRALVVLTGIAVFQLLPLPPALLRFLDGASADASARALSAWQIDRSAAWRPLHRDPGTGLSDLVFLAGLGATFVAAKAASSRDGLESLYAVVASSALIIAVLALAHFGIGQDKVFGFYQPRAAAPPIVSPLLNPNHLAALTGAGAVLWMGWSLSTARPLMRIARALGAVACGVACALSLSRGGVAAAVGGISLLVGLNARNAGELANPKRRKRLAIETLVGLGLGVAIIAAGLYVAATALSREYLSGDASKLDNFRRALGLIRGHEFFGVGSGALPLAVTNSGVLNPDWTFLRVECLPIDLALAYGVPAAAFALYCLGRALARWFPSVKAPPSALGAWCALVTLLVHDLSDFALFLGGTGYFAAALAGLLAGHHARGWKAPLPHSTTSRRGVALVLAVLTVALGWSARRSPLEPDRDNAEALLRGAPTAYRGAEMQAALLRHPADAYLHLLAGSYAIVARDPMALRFVGRAMELSPTWAQPHLLLARVFAAYGFRSQSMVELREALQRSPQVRRAASDVVLSMRPRPPVEQLDRIAPRSPAGAEFLDYVASRSGEAAYSEAVDMLLLQRIPTADSALLRRAAARRAAGDLTGAEAFCQRTIQAVPRSPTGYVCKAEMLVARERPEEALRSLEFAVRGVTDGYPLHALRARLFARLNDPGGMRRETAAMLDASGADVDRLVAAHGLRGELEAQLRNDRGAWASYELAHSLAAPEQPYLLQLAQIASRLRDRPSLEAACSVLMDHTPPSPEAVALCDRSAARQPGSPLLRTSSAVGGSSLPIPGWQGNDAGREDAGESPMPAMGSGR